MGTNRGGALEVALTEGQGEPAVHVEDVNGEALGELWVHVELRFGTERFAWDVGPLYGEEASMDVPLLVPAGALVHPEQARYVTPLKVTASTVRGRTTVDVALAWPDGLESPAEVWDRATVDARAPQGVLDPSLREEPSGLRALLRDVVPSAISGPARPRGGTEVDR